MRIHQRKHQIALLCALAYVVVACVARGPGTVPQYSWWLGLGPVVPHETFPADCTLCHLENRWQKLNEDFSFDHEAETGVALSGAHAAAKCLRCHNDRGPVSEFAARGCAGCHEDIHFGQLGPDCTSCHQDVSWDPVGMFELHNQTRFPLFGTHASTACRRCHLGAEVGFFIPLDTECLTCHRDDLARGNATFGAHQLLIATYGIECDNCHRPTIWKQAEIPQ